MTVNFLGKEYSIPEDVLTYIDLLAFTDSIQKQLTTTFVRKLNNIIQSGETGLLGDKDMAADIEYQVGRFISKLTEKGIYDRTVNDYLCKNEGYKLISKVNADALDEAKRSLKQQMSDWLEGYENAIQKKEASVTGLGFSIWSGSFVNHAIYAAMEASKLHEQEQAAVKQYQKDMDELDARIESKKNADEKWYISNTYIPHMEAAITVLSYELLDTYISDLISYGKLNKDVLNYIHIDRSNDLLKNLELSQNKEVILLKAFEACPYNIAVYMQAMKYDLLDYESFQTAKLFGHGDTIVSFLEENLGSSPKSEKRQLNFKTAELLSVYTDTSLRDVTAYMADYIVNGYSQTIALLSNKMHCKNIMSKATENDILAGNTVATAKVNWLVDPLAPELLWNKLTKEYGHSDLFDRLVELLSEKVNVNNKQEYDAYLKQELFTILESVRVELVEEILARKEAEKKQREAEAERTRVAAERRKLILKWGIRACSAILSVVIVVSIIGKIVDSIAYKKISGEYCVYQVIDDDGDERDEYNWWLSIEKDGTINLTSYSYAIDDTAVNSYSGKLKNKANFRKFKDYRIEDYSADVSKYKEAQYCYEFNIADEWNEFTGYVVCWQYHNGKIIDVYCNDHRYSFVETSVDYSFNKWESEINSNELSRNVQKLIDNIDVLEEDIVEEIENLISNGNYDNAVKAIVASKLTDEQKNTYYNSLVDKIDFKSFEVNGLVVNIPEDWSIRDYSDPNITSAYNLNSDTFYASWYVKCMGTVNQVVTEGDDIWTRDKDYSPVTLAGCTEAYTKRELSQKSDNEGYSAIDYYIICQDFVYKIQYFAYDERFFEPEMHMLLEHVEFTNYAENLADIQEEKYLNAINLFNEGKYEEALSIFDALKDYKESKQKITECKGAIVEKKYNNAIALVDKGKYKDAILLFNDVGNYKDAIELSRKYTLISCEVSDIITFGSYEQDNNRDNGAEPIEWIVLKRDGNKVFAISKYCIENKPFNTTLTPVTWANSTIRKWLNGDFLYNAFSDKERAKILSSTIKNPDDEDQERPSKNTVDKIFLLSSYEASIYFDTDSDRAAHATDYVSTNHCYWILRTPATNGPYVCHVDYTGELGYSENVDRKWWIRPAMWIEIDR